MKNYVNVLKGYTIMHGRTRRREFWTFNLLNGFYFFLLFAINFILYDPDIEKIFIIISVISALLIIVPTFTVSVRRLHDTGRNEWCLLINLVPVIGSIIFLCMMMEDSTPGLNEYGEYPKFKLYF